MTDHLKGVVLDRGIEKVPNLTTEKTPILSGWEAGFRAALNVTPDNVRYITKSGLCRTFEDAATLWGMIVPQTDKRHDFIKAVKVDQCYTWFIEFLVPNDTRIKGDIEPERARMRVLEELRGVLVQNGQVHPNITEFYRARPTTGNDDRPTVMTNFDAHFASIVNSRDGNGLWTLPANMLDIVTALKQVYISEDFTHRMKPFMTNAFEVAITLSKMGSLTDDKHTRITEQIRDEKQIMLKMSVQEYGILWKFISRECARHTLPIPGLLKMLHRMISMEDDLRINLTLRQSADSGVAGVTIVSEAFKSFPNSPLWNYALKELGTEYHNWLIAARMVANDAYIGFGNREDTEKVKSTRFPNLYYLAKMVMSEIGGDRNVKRIKTGSIVTKKAEIDRLIELEKNRVTKDMDIETYKFEEGHNAFTMAADMEHVLNSL